MRNSTRHSSLLLSGASVAVTALIAFACSAPPAAENTEITGSSTSDLTAAQCNYFSVNGKVTICHATGSKKNPYTVVRVSDEGCIEGHAKHATDYVAANDPTCGGEGYLPPDAPCDAALKCSEGYECRTGTCQPTDRCIGVTCDAIDACHYATCNPGTGQCSQEPTNGNACNDGNACTQTDTCVAGACQGANPVACNNGDQCASAGSCDPGTGACSAPTPVADGRPCSDRNACTQQDTCVAGACRGADPVVCTNGSQCESAGSCDPGTGACSAPTPVADGVTCSDGDACTQEDSCVAGACQGANPVVCNNGSACQTAGSCDPGTGACTSATPVADGTSCTDGNTCTGADTCSAGACTSGAPIACLATGPNLVRNGSFETGSYIPVIASHFVTIAPGSTQIDNWTVSGGTVDWSNTGTGIGPYADGGRGVDLVHDGAGACQSRDNRGELSQLVPTTVGATYRLTFHAASPSNPGDPNPTGCAGPDIRPVKASAGAASQVYLVGAPPAGSPSFKALTWERKELVFVATASSTLITLSAPKTPKDGYWGPWVDAVSVNQVFDGACIGQCTR